MKRLALIAALACACSLRAPRNDETPCTADRQCGGDVCFLGQCRPRAADLSVVAAEIRPPNDSSYGVLQAGGLDLRQSVERDFVLLPFFAASGSVAQLNDAGTSSAVSAQVTFSSYEPPIADRVLQYSTTADATGAFSLHLPQGLWSVLVDPPAPFPPWRPDAPFSTANPALALALPPLGALVPLQGSVLANGAPVDGATITAVDATGEPLSSPATLADGGYSLYLPADAGAGSYFLEVGPEAVLDGGVPGSLPDYDRLSPASMLSIDLPPEAVLTGTVADALGAPVAGAAVYAKSTGEPWALSRSVTAAADGTFSFTLRAGSYLVEAAPSAAPASPAVSSAVAVDLPAGGTQVALICPPKLTRTGQVLLPDGTIAGVGYQVTASRLADPLLTTRSATTTPTDSGGAFQIVGDPGTYRVEISPPPGVNLPRRIVQITLGTGPLPPIQLDRPLTVVGTIAGRGPSGVLVLLPGANVSFFATDATGASVFLGSASTDSEGRYSCVLPDVANP